MNANNTAEIDLEEAKKLIANGSKIMLFERSYAEVQVLSETFGVGEDRIGIIDMNDVQVLHMHYGEEADIAKIANKFDNAVIVCQHGNTSRMMVKILANEKVKAYSLIGGTTGIAGHEF
jgi:rhodanese-related sulfurtransferase